MFHHMIDDNNHCIYKPLKDHQTLLIPYSREGWCFSLRLLLKSYFYPNQPSLKFLYSDIRPKGQALKTFGGVSSGHEPLKMCHQTIRTILNQTIGLKINSKINTDLCCVIGRMVVSGNVRRSAMVAMGKSDDEMFLNLKDYSIFLDRIEYGTIEHPLEDYKHIIQRLKTNGEPGLLFYF